MRNHPVAAVVFVVLSALAAACSSADPSADKNDTAAGAASKDKAAEPAKSTAPVAPPPVAAATTTTACADISGSYMPSEASLVSGNCALPSSDGVNPYVVKKSADGKWELVDGDTTLSGTLDMTNCTLHVELFGDSGVVTGDYHFTPTGFTSELTMSITAQGTSDCAGKFAQAAKKQ